MKLPRLGNRALRLIAATSMTAACVAGAMWATTAAPAVLVVLGSCLTLSAASWLLAAGSAAHAVRARAEIADREAEVSRLQAKLVEVANSQGRFVANIAHEIKTPLTIALLQADFLIRGCDDPAMVRAHAKGISADLSHLSALVDGFLRLARPFSQADTTHHVAVDVRDFVVAAAQHCQPTSLERGVRVVVKFAESGDDLDPWSVCGEATLLEAMLENLLRNALRFAPRGSAVDLAVQSRDQTIQLLVRDQGAGIAADQLESVFDWFFQAPGATLPSAGTGFGLAIAQRIAEHHGGAIALRNVPAGGCEFEVTLPRRITDLAVPLCVAREGEREVQGDKLTIARG